MTLRYVVSFLLDKEMKEVRMKYVLNLLSKMDGTNYNNYGYYQGKCYTVQGESFPICSNDIDDTVKKYTSVGRVKRAGESLCEKCGYVTGYEVYQLTEDGNAIMVDKA